MKKLSLFFSAMPFLILAGCQTMPYQPYAREVKRKPGVAGEISLKVEHRDEDRAKAQQMMDSNCGSNVAKIEEEGEVEVGTTTNSNASQTHNAGSSGTQVGSLWGMPITSGAQRASNDTATTATTTSLKEWLIKYTCAKPDHSGETHEVAPAPIVKKRKASTEE